MTPRYRCGASGLVVRHESGTLGIQVERVITQYKDPSGKIHLVKPNLNIGDFLPISGLWLQDRKLIVMTKENELLDEGNFSIKDSGDLFFLSDTGNGPLDHMGEKSFLGYRVEMKADFFS